MKKLNSNDIEKYENSSEGISEIVSERSGNSEMRREEERQRQLDQE
jgi:hypothetical protein